MVIVIVTLAMIAFLMVMGLALDSANLFRARLTLQNAVDAAALGGVGHVAANGSTAAAIADGQVVSRRLLRENVSGYNLEADDADLTATFNTDARTSRAWMNVTARAQVRLLLVGSLPGLGPIRSVAASAQADILPANVALLLDTSDSMACSAANSNSAFCGCGAGGASCDPAESKLKFLKDASRNFLTYFDQTRDRIAVIAYNTGAQTLVNFQGTGFNAATLNGAINGLSAVGYTNHCDAFMQAYMAGKAIDQLSNMSYVVFSDGPPTAARFWFDYNPATPRTHGALPANQTQTWRDDSNNVLSRYDYYNWAYRHEQPSQFTEIPTRMVPAPGGPIGWTPYGYPGPGMPAGCNYVNGSSGDRCPGCSYMGDYEDRPAFGWLCFRSTVPALDGLAPFFSLDGQRWRRVTPVDVAVDPANPGGNPYRWWKMYYDCAVAHSDAARQQGGLWFTIGLGQPAISGAAGDPYQDVADVWNRKDVLLRRISFDACAQLDPDFPEVQNFGTMVGNGYRHGMSLTTTDPADLDRLFTAVAVKIKSLLVR